MATRKSLKAKERTNIPLGWFLSLRSWRMDTITMVLPRSAAANVNVKINMHKMYMNFVSALQLSSILKHSSISYWWEEFLWFFNMVIISMKSVICVDTWQSRKQWSIVERSVDWLKNCSSDINFNVRPIQQYIAKVKSLSVQFLYPVIFKWRFFFLSIYSKQYS